MTRETKISDNLTTTDMKKLRDNTLGGKCKEKATDEQFQEAIEQGRKAIENIKQKTGDLQHLTPRELKDFAKTINNWIDNHSSKVPGQELSIRITADNNSEITVNVFNIALLEKLYQRVHDAFFNEFRPA